MLLVEMLLRSQNYFLNRVFMCMVSCIRLLLMEQPLFLNTVAHFLYMSLLSQPIEFLILPGLHSAPNLSHLMLSMQKMNWAITSRNLDSQNNFTTTVYYWLNPKESLSLRLKSLTVKCEKTHVFLLSTDLRSVCNRWLHCDQACRALLLWLQISYRR